MKRKFRTPEQIVKKLREADAAVASGSTVEQVCKQSGISDANGYIESFNGKLRDEILDCELFYSVKEAKVIVEDWRLKYNNHRPHGGLGYMTPAAFAAGCVPSASPTAQPQEYGTGNVDISLIKVGT